MPEMLSVYINGVKTLEYDKQTRQPGQQRKFLDGMDRDMDEGIRLNGAMIDAPDQMQRAYYIVMRLFDSLEHENQGLITATCGYLATRLPELKQIRAIEHGEEYTFDLIFNEIN